MRECRECGRSPLQGHGWCGACYKRWLRGGKVGTELPPRKRVQDLEGHLEDCRFLLGSGVTDPAVLASRMGVSASSVRRYLRAISRETAAASGTAPGRTAR